MRAIQQLAVEKRTPEQRQQLLEFYSREISKSKAPTRRQLAQLSKRLKELKPETTVPVMQDRPNDKQRKTFVQIRGNYKSLGQEGHAGTPEVLTPISYRSQLTFALLQKGPKKGCGDWSPR